MNIPSHPNSQTTLVILGEQLGPAVSLQMLRELSDALSAPEVGLPSLHGAGGHRISHPPGSQVPNDGENQASILSSMWP